MKLRSAPVLVASLLTVGVGISGPFDELRPDIKVGTVWQSADGAKVEVLGVCKADESDVVCWKTDGTDAPELRHWLREASLDYGSPLKFRPGLKNRWVLLGVEGTDKTRLSCVSIGATRQELHYVGGSSESGVAVLSVNALPNADTVPLLAEISGTVSHFLDLPLKKGAGGEYRGTRFELGAWRKFGPSKVAVSVAERRMPRWLITVGCEGESRVLLRDFSYRLLTKDKREIRYVDRDSNPVSAVMHASLLKDGNRDDTESDPNALSTFSTVKARYDYAEGVGFLETTTNPNRAGYVRIYAEGTARVLFTGIGLDVAAARRMAKLHPSPSQQPPTRPRTRVPFRVVGIGEIGEDSVRCWDTEGNLSPTLGKKLLDNLAALSWETVEFEIGRENRVVLTEHDDDFRVSEVTNGNHNIHLHSLPFGRRSGVMPNTYLTTLNKGAETFTVATSGTFDSADPIEVEFREGGVGRHADRVAEVRRIRSTIRSGSIGAPNLLSGKVTTFLVGIEPATDRGEFRASMLDGKGKPITKVDANGVPTTGVGMAAKVEVYYYTGAGVSYCVTNVEKHHIGRVQLKWSRTTNFGIIGLPANPKGAKAPEATPTKPPVLDPYTGKTISLPSGSKILGACHITVNDVEAWDCDGTPSSALTDIVRQGLATGNSVYARFGKKNRFIIVKSGTDFKNESLLPQDDRNRSCSVSFNGKGIRLEGYVADKDEDSMALTHHMTIWDEKPLEIPFKQGGSAMLSDLPITMSWRPATKSERETNPFILQSCAMWTVELALKEPLSQDRGFALDALDLAHKYPIDVDKDGKLLLSQSDPEYDYFRVRPPGAYQAAFFSDDGEKLILRFGSSINPTQIGSLLARFYTRKQTKLPPIPVEPKNNAGGLK